MLKKFVALFLVFGVLLTFFCGCENANTNSTLTDSQTTTESNKEIQQSANDRTLIVLPESMAEKITREMDEAFEADSKLPEYSSTAGMSMLYEKYAEKWQQIADEYYNKIMEYEDIITPSDIYYNSEDLHTFVADMKTNWEQYNQEQCENYLKTLRAIYGAGTIVGPLISNYRCIQYKEWALQLVGICQQLYIE